MILKQNSSQPAEDFSLTMESELSGILAEYYLDKGTQLISLTEASGVVEGMSRYYAAFKKLLSTVKKAISRMIRRWVKFNQFHFRKWTAWYSRISTRVSPGSISISVVCPVSLTDQYGLDDEVVNYRHVTVVDYYLLIQGSSPEINTKDRNAIPLDTQTFPAKLVNELEFVEDQINTLEKRAKELDSGSESLKQLEYALNEKQNQVAKLTRAYKSLSEAGDQLRKNVDDYLKKSSY